MGIGICIRMGLLTITGQEALSVAITSPSVSAVIPINSPITISGTVTGGASSVQVYLDYPATPIGSATIVGSTWSISYTPDLNSHGSHTLAAYAVRGVEVVSDTRAVRVSAVVNDGVWATNQGAYYDFRLITTAPGLAAPTVSPLEGTGDLVPENSPLMASGGGSRPAIDFVSGSLQRMTATSGTAATTPSGVRTSFIIGGLVNITTGSGTIFGWGRAGSNNDYFKLATSSGKILSSIQRKAGADAAVTGTVASSYDLDVPSLQRRAIEVQYDATNDLCYLFVNGVADPTNPQTLAAASTSLGCDLFRIAAWGLNSNAQNSSGQYQVLWLGRVPLDGATGALARYNWCIASDLVAPVGAGFMMIGDSTTLGSISTGGFRKTIADGITTNGWTVSPVGPRAYGGFTNNQCNAQGGNNMSAINTQQIVPFVGTGKGFATTKHALLITGTNDVDEASITASTCMTRYSTLLGQLHTALVTSQATARIAVSTFLPYDPASNAAAAANVTSINGGLIQAVWNTFDASHPSNTLIRFDAYAALGSGWNSTDMADSRHPSQTGYGKIGNAYLTAASSYLATLTP